MDFGVIESIDYDVNLNSGDVVRLAQVVILDEDVVTVELPFSEGDELNPAVGDTVYFEEIDEGFLVGRCVQSSLDVDDSLNEGERELFSKSGTSRQATIRLKNNGEIVLKGGTDYAVKFNKLKSGIDTILTALASHTHACPAGGGTTTALTYITTPSSDSINGAKVEKVRL